MTAPHERPEFVNSTEYTVAITFRVEGGARWQTAHRRARRIAVRLANAAARAAQVVEVTALGGASVDGTPIRPERIRFTAANSGHGTYADPATLDRYLDPEFERALRSLDEVNTATALARKADRQRRQDLGCLNTYRQPSQPRLRCLCAYCRPAVHEHALQRAQAGTPDPLATPRCVCGQAVPAPGLSCARHRGHDLVVLDGDPPALQRLARRLQADLPRPARDDDGPEPPTPAL